MLKTRSFLIVISGLFVLGCSCANAAVDMKIVTPKGYVAFTVGDNWTTIAMQTKLPIATAAFQLPNPNDNGTSDSTNLAIMLYEPDSDKARDSFEAEVKQYGPKAPLVQSLKKWTIYRQEAKQGNTPYSIIDAKRKDVGDVWVSIRLAWPHLAGNPKSYDSEMESTFRAFMNSIYGRIGSVAAAGASDGARGFQVPKDWPDQDLYRAIGAAYLKRGMNPQDILTVLQPIHQSLATVGPDQSRQTLQQMLKGLVVE
jgi:hypothetical protein